MKRQIIYFIVVLCAFFMLCCGSGTKVYAYTEEEKQQAKAWLSAHGYSPDMNGANQAYQDYLNGKFDEELGIATTEQQTPENAEPTTESQTESSAKIQENESQNAEVKQSDSTPGRGNYESEKASSTESNTTDEDSIEDFEKEGTMEPEQMTDDEPDEMEASGEIVLYQDEKTDTYKEAGIVILLSVMLVAVLVGAWQLLRKIPNKDNS